MLAIKQLELSEFFGVEPISLDSDSLWPYGHFTYKVSTGDLSLSCSIDPADQDIEIVVTKNLASYYHMNADNILDLRLLKDNDKSTLEVTLDTRSRVLFKLKPRISIVHLAPRNV